MKYIVCFVCWLAVLFFTSHLLQAQQPAPFLGSAIEHQPDIKALRSQFQFGSGTRFIENKGQIADTKGNPRPDIKYYTEGTNGVRMYFSADKISYVFAQYDTATSFSLSSQQTLTLPLSQRERERTNGNSFSPLLRGTTGCPQVTQVESLYRMDMNILGASPTEIVRAGESQDRTNYYCPHCPNGVTNVHSYSTITYKNIYPNIDLIYRQNTKGVKYDLIVNPGGNVSDIRLQYNGANNMNVTSDGRMQITNPFGKVQEDIPYTYQTGANAPAMLDVFDSHKDGGMQTVSASYKIKGNVVTFAVGAYDRTRPLVIDPTLAWCTFYGGIGSENEASLGYIGEIIADGSGNIVITGTTNSVNFPVTIGAFQTTYGGAGISGQGDAYIVKFDDAGNRLWATYYGGSGDEEGTGIAVDKGGNIFITGETQSLDFPTSTNALQTTLQGTANSYLVKFDSTGVRQWATYYGGNNEYGEQVTTDLNGNVVMIGSAYTGFPVTNGAFQTTFGGGLGDAFVVKFDGNGNRQWATYCGGNDVDNGYGIATDKSGNIFITGWTASKNFPVTAGAFQTSLSSKNNGQGNAFIAKFSSAGKQLWATYYGGSNDDIGYAIAIDSSDNIFITGATGSSDFPVTKGAYQTVYALQSDAFIVKFDVNGNRQWATYYGGRDVDAGFGIAIDADDNILISGRTTGNFPVTNDAFQSNLINCAFVLKFDNNGTKRLWATQFGSTDKTVLTFGNGITTDPSGNIFIIGETNDLNGHFPVTPGAFQTSNGGQWDAFVAKFEHTCNVMLNFRKSKDTVCRGVGVIVGDTASNGVPPYTYAWAPTQGLSAANIATPVAVPDSTTTYYDTVRDANGCVDMDSVTVVVRQSPQVVSLSKITTCKGTRVALSANAGGGVPPYTYMWRPAYRLSSTNTLTPFATPDSTTMYYITVTDALGCAGIDSELVIINQPPQLNAGDTGTMTICKGSAITIGGQPVSGTAPYKFQWSPATGLSATNVASPVANPTATTTYTVIITDANGCQSKGQVTVKIASSLAPVISVNGSPTLCGNDSVVLDAGSGYATYLWNTGAATESITVTQPGEYVVTVTDGTGCSGTSDTVTVTAGNGTTPRIAGLDTVCANTDDVYSVTSAAGDTYTWSVTGGAISAGQGTNSVTVQWGGVGNGSVSLTETRGTCTGDTTINVNIGNGVTPAVTVSGAITFCTGDSVTLTAPNGFATYLWSDGETTQSIVVRTSGTYTVTVTATGGCTGTSAPVTVTVGSTLTPVITGATAFCPGDSVVLDAGAGYDTYQWNTSATTETIVVKTPGTYSVSVTKGTCAGTSANFTVTEYPAPIASITENGDTLIAGIAASYQWNLNGVAIANAAKQKYVAIQPGNYTVTISDMNGCMAVSPVYIQTAGVADICLGIATPMVNPRGALNAIVDLGSAIYPPTDSIIFDLHYDIQALEFDSIGGSSCLISTQYISAGVVRARLAACSAPLPAGALCTAVFTPLVSSRDTFYTQLMVDNVQIYPLSDSIAGTGCSIPITVLPLCGLHGVLYMGSTSLAQNYPNPFTGTTAIHVTLSQADANNAQLMVYNMLGEQVADLTSELSTDGNVTFNAGANKAGVYYYVLQTASGRMTRQMFVVK